MNVGRHFRATCASSSGGNSKRCHSHRGQRCSKTGKTGEICCPLPASHPRQVTPPRTLLLCPTKPCQSCGSRRRGSKMVLCDKCQDGFHIRYLYQPLVRWPTGWLRCNGIKVMLHTILTLNFSC